MKFNYVYSPSTNGMYPISMKPDYVRAGSWPKDAIEISDDIYNEFSQNPPDGKMRSAVDGLPSWVDVPLPTESELIAEAEGMKAALMYEATLMIDPLQDAVDLEMATSEEKKLLNEWKKYRVLLNRINVAEVSGIAWPEKP